MPLRDSWPSFPEERVLHDDDDLIVIDKPAGISTHAPDALRTDDAVTRVKLWLAERRGCRPEEVYLGIHQRLDRDTSGVLLFTKRPEANGSIARQFESQQIRKTYVAAVMGWPPSRNEGLLRHRLVEARDGRMRATAVSAETEGQKKATKRGPEHRPKSGARGQRGHEHRSSSGGREQRGPEREKRVAPRGQLAVTRFRVLRSHQGRTLLELRPETGRTHQIRVQIAAMGTASHPAAVAGDPWYGGALAPRLLLHAASLALEHPKTRRGLTFRAPLPVEIERWVDGAEIDPFAAITTASDHAERERPLRVATDAAELTRLLRLAAESRWALARSDTTDAFRLVHEAADGLPGLAIDVYGEFLVVHLSSPAAEAARESILDAAFALGPRGVYVKSHPKQKNTLVDPKSDALGLAPPHAVRGESASAEVVIREDGLRYAARLADGLKTGIFLDQRENRRRVREMAAGKTVLNLFAYTCAFSVAAAAGKAKRTVSVDATASVLERGRGNFALNELDERARKGADEMLEVDVFEWLKRAVKKGERFDLVIVDPPSYATTHSSRFSLRDDFADLAALALGVVAPGGKLVACSNHRGVARARLRRQLHEAGRASGRTLQQIKDWPDSLDFPAEFGQEAFLKTMLVTVGS